MSNSTDNEKKISDRELISGRIYSRDPINEEVKEKAEYFQEILNNYNSNKNADITIFNPFKSINLDKTNNTIIRPLIAVKKNESLNQIDWVIDYAKNANDVLAFCIKPVVFKDAGISEYWILDLENRAIIIYNLEKNGFIQQVISDPRRLKVGIFNSLLLNYSDIFVKEW